MLGDFMESENFNLSASQEDYLETIYNLIQKKGAARPKDIAAKLDVRAASVTGALRILTDIGLINYAPYEAATLTKLGEKVAKTITRKHDALLNFFVNVLDIKKEEAEDCCCKMEHLVPDHILERFIRFAEFVKKCPHSKARWDNDDYINRV